MPTRVTLRALTADERNELERLDRSRTEEVQLVQRVRIILGLAGGERPTRVATRLGVGRMAVYEWLRRFNAEGLRGLADHPRSGRPRTYTPAQTAEVKAAVLTRPDALGLPFGSWTLDRLQAYLNDVKGIPIKRTRINELLAAEGLRWRRAELWLTSPDLHYAEKKARRDEYIRLAGEHPEWVVGFLDEVWWSRLARPPLRAWSAGDPVKLRVLSQPEGDPDPAAICCYGMLRQDTDSVMIRFVEGRPVGDVTTQFLVWVCEQLEAEGKARLVVIWDDASWHSGKPVTDWVAGHNRAVGSHRGVHIVLCPLPVGSPWLNNIETRWGPAKRAILEPDRILTGEEVFTRVCEHFGCAKLPYLKSKVAQTAQP